MAELILKSDPNIDPSTKVADDNTHLLRNRLEKSFMLVLPKNESKMNASSKTRPAMGMSGSSVFVKHDNKLQFGGVFWGAMQIEVGGEEFDIGFFHGIDEVREALKEKKVELLPNH
jgi:hypothetical protein